MKEVEVKAKVDSIEEFKNKLITLGCTWSPMVVQDDINYLHNSLEFKDIKKDVPVLRIRNAGGVIRLTLKKRVGGALDKIEEEIIVDSAETTERILKHMDYHEILRINKQRQETRFGDITICLDEVENLGTFIEAEKIIEETADSIKVQDELWAFFENLGVNPSDRVFKGYDTLLHEKMKNYF